MKMKSESQLQSTCFIWAWNHRPETRGLLCCNLNNSANIVQGNRNKSMGVIPGRSDMVLYWAGRALHIEFKLPGGRQSKAQREWQAAIEAAGFRYVIIRDEASFREFIDAEVSRCK